MELDGYSTGLKLAFEHHGIQHFEYVPFFHTSQKFRRTMELDDEKRRACADNGISLIEVRWDCSDIGSFVRGELRRLGVFTQGEV